MWHEYENGQNIKCGAWELSSQLAEICGFKELFLLTIKICIKMGCYLLNNVMWGKTVINIMDIALAGPKHVKLSF
jgi:hypothetical protein